MPYKTYCAVSGALFSIVAVAHLLRIINGLPITAGTYDVPMLASWIGLIVPAGLAIWAFRIARS